MNAEQISCSYQPPAINIVCQYKLVQFLKEVPILEHISEFRIYWRIICENLQQHNFPDPVVMLERHDPKEIANCYLTYEKTMANLVYQTTLPKYHYLFNKYAEFSSPTMCMLLELKVMYGDWKKLQFESQMIKLSYKQSRQQGEVSKTHRESMNIHHYKVVPVGYTRLHKYMD
ncbi:unnamed protein product [Ambrosiozyma monospora]|uniref:Unnamed protein product n=1 Tax=Ambrosiozyma monospora TaxID=43982 RepID=A0ACB5SRE0_AMBMO|nr:unnamed protein product [Ambrosiozyma monospora]